jgi:hypothetical protein
MEDRGGLSLIILDDLQEFFDKPNRERIANSLQDIINKGSRLLVTTNDPVFGKQVTLSCPKVSLDRRQIHPIKTIRPHIELGIFREIIEEKRLEYKKPENVDEHQPACDYIIELRIYIENILKDFYDGPCPSLPLKPTLSDLLNGIRRWHKSGQAPFTEQVFINLLTAPALQNGSQFIELMNKSHHGGTNEIKYKEVSDNESNCTHTQYLVESAYEAYMRWMRRVPLPKHEKITMKPEIPQSDMTLKINIPIYEDLAAATIDSGLSEINNPTEFFSTERLGEYAIYVVNADSLGFSAKKHSRVIVKTDDSPVEDNSLVIALYKDKIYARRFLRQDNNPEVIALCSEDVNPINRAPSLLLPIGEVRLLEIIGVIFENTPYWQNNKGEAALIEKYQIPFDPKVAFKVRGDSALPLALKGQVVVGSEKSLRTQLKDGELVAISFDGKDAFKRVGSSLPSQPRLRLFESIGGLGESLVLRTEEIEDDPFSKIPLIDESVYKITGVIYT